jgi:arabinofuranosyltransferase
MYLARWVTLVLPALLLLALGWLTLRAQGYFLPDDAYISFRYARHLAEGLGLVWNPGEPVEGYTNLLWVLLLTPLALFKIDLGVAAPFVSALAGVGCLEVLRRISQNIWPDRSAAVRMLPGLILATNPSMAYWAMQGMETTFFAFWVLLSAALLIHSRTSRRHAWAAGLTLAAAILTRPEGILVAGLFLLAEVCSTEGTCVERIKQQLPATCIVTAVVGMHLSFRVLYYDAWLPNTYYAKVIWGVVSAQRGLAHVWEFFKAGGCVLLPGVLALRWRSHRAFLIYGYLLLLCYVCYLMLVGGDLPLWYRFYVPLMPLPIVGVSRLLVAIADELQRKTFLSRLFKNRCRSVLGATVMLLLCLAPTPFFWLRAETRFIQRAKGMGEFHTFLAALINRDLTRENLIAVGAVGFLGYHTECRILDLFGLNDRVIAHAKVTPRPGGIFAHDKSDWIYVFSKLPDYILTDVPVGRSTPLVRGYDQCLLMKLLPGILMLRRNFPLSPQQRQLGMPADQLRAVTPPPPC